MTVFGQDDRVATSWRVSDHVQFLKVNAVCTTLNDPTQIRQRCCKDPRARSPRLSTGNRKSRVPRVLVTRLFSWYFLLPLRAVWITTTTRSRMKGHHVIAEPKWVRVLGQDTCNVWLGRLNSEHRLRLLSAIRGTTALSQQNLAHS